MSRILGIGLCATLVASFGMLITSSGRMAVEDTAAASVSRHAPRNDGAIRRFVSDAEQDQYAGQCIAAIKSGAVDEAGSLIAKLVVTMTGRMGIPRPSDATLDGAFAFGGSTVETVRLEAELAEHEAAGRWYEATFTKAKILGIQLELAGFAVPGGQLFAESVGLTVHGIDCLKMGFDFFADKGSQLGRYLREEYDRQLSVPALPPDAKEFEDVRVAPPGFDPSTGQSLLPGQSDGLSQPNGPGEEQVQQQEPPQQTPGQQAPQQQAPQQQAPQQTNSPCPNGMVGSGPSADGTSGCFVPGSGYVAPSTKAPEPTASEENFVTMPGVVGMETTAAVAAIRRAGFGGTFDTKQEFICDVDRDGRIIAQSPAQGARIRSNGTVALTAGRLDDCSTTLAG